MIANEEAATSKWDRHGACGLNHGMHMHALCLDLPDIVCAVFCREVLDIVLASPASIGTS